MPTYVFERVSSHSPAHQPPDRAFQKRQSTASASERRPHGKAQELELHNHLKEKSDQHRLDANRLKYKPKSALYRLYKPLIKSN